MSLKQNIKAVLKEMSFDRVVILCYDYFPAVYRLLSPQISHKAVITLLLAEAELPKLARVIGLPMNDKKKKKKQADESAITGDQVAVVSGKAKVTGGIHFGDNKK